jgi:hypothetical protein
MTNRYFYINDLQLIGKTVNDCAYLYKNRSWEDDRDTIIHHRLSGYCPITKTEGNPHMLVKIDEITKEEAERLMHLF